MTNLETLVPDTCGDLIQTKGELLVLEGDLGSRKMFLRCPVPLVFSRTGEEAIELAVEAKRSNKEIIGAFIDLEISGSPGAAETARVLRELHPAMRWVMTSANPQGALPVLEREFQGGACDQWGFFRKPFTMDELVQQVHYFTACHARQRDYEQARNRLEQEIADKARELVRSNASLRRMAEELERALSRMERRAALDGKSNQVASIAFLAAGMAHEINNPIGYIGGNLVALERHISDLICVFGSYRDLVRHVRTGAREEIRTLMDALDALEREKDVGFIVDDASRLIVECRDGVEHVKNLVASLRDFADDDTTSHRPFELNEGIRNTLNLLKPEVPSSCTVEFFAEPLPRVRCNGVRITQVVANLVRNALEALSDRGAVSVSTAQAQDGFIEVRVQDNGCGIPEENLLKIFEPFFTTKVNGTGLGLSLSRKIVMDHKGLLLVEAAAGGGSVFTMKLPVDSGVQPCLENTH